MAVLTSTLAAVAAGVSAVAGLAGTAVSMKAAHDQKKAMKPTPAYNADKENQKAALQEAEANKKRVMGETDTIKTSALGNTGATQTQKKTILGG